MPTQRLLAITAAASGAATAALAQDAALEIRVLGDVTPAKPFVDIDVWAHFPPEDYALADARYSLHAGSPAFSHAGCRIVGCYLGPVTESTRIDVGEGQIHFPPTILADPSNPIWVLRASWGADDLAPRVVDLWTETTHFRAFIERDLVTSESRLDRLVEGAARIRVLDRECYTDCDASGALDFTDFLCFQNLYAASEPLADCDLDGQLDFFDFLCFQNAFAAGCP